MLPTFLQAISRSLGGPSDNINPSTVTTSATTSQTTSDTEDQSVPDSYDQEDDVVSDNEAPASSNSSSRPRSRRPRKDDVTEDPVEPAPRRKSPHNPEGSLDRNRNSSEMPRSSSQRKRQNSATNPPPDVSNVSGAHAHSNVNQPSSRRAPARSATRVSQKKKEHSVFKAPATALVTKGEITSLPIGPKRGRISGPEHDQHNEDLDRFHPSLANTPEAGSPPSLPVQQPIIAQPSQPSEKRTLRSQEPVKQEGRLFEYVQDVLDGEWERTQAELAYVPIDAKMTIVDEFEGEGAEKLGRKTGKGKKRTSSERLASDAAGAVATATATVTATAMASTPYSPKSQEAQAVTDEYSESQEPPRKKQDTKDLAPALKLEKFDISKYFSAKDAERIKVDPLADGRYAKYHKKGEKNETRNKTYEQGTWLKKVANMEDMRTVLEGPSWYKEFRLKTLRGLQPEELEKLEAKRAFAINKANDFLEKNARYKERERMLKNHKGEWRGGYPETSPSHIDEAEYVEREAVTHDQDTSGAQAEARKPTDEFEFQEEEHLISSKRRPIAKATSKLAKLPSNSSDSVKSDTKSKAIGLSKQSAHAKADGKLSNGKPKEIAPIEAGVIPSSKKGYVYVPDEKPEEAQEETPVIPSRLRSGNNKRKAEELSKPDTESAPPPPPPLPSRASKVSKGAASKAPSRGKPAAAMRKPPARGQQMTKNVVPAIQTNNTRRSGRLAGQEPSIDTESSENGTKRQKTN